MVWIVLISGLLFGWMRRVQFSFMQALILANTTEIWKLCLLCVLVLSTDVLRTIGNCFSSSSSSSGNSMADKDCAFHFSRYSWAHKDRSGSNIKPVIFLSSLSLPISIPPVHHHVFFSGIDRPYDSSDVYCPGGIWPNSGPNGPECWTSRQCFCRCFLASSPRY